MFDKKARLAGLLACHGADISRWPEDVRADGISALEAPELAALIRQEEGFERQLRACSSAPGVPHGLEQRIITASFTRPQSKGFWLADRLGEIRPAALAAMLVLGFAIGFSLSNPSPAAPDAQTAQYSDDEEAIL